MEHIHPNKVGYTLVMQNRFGDYVNSNKRTRNNLTCKFSIH